MTAIVQVILVVAGAPLLVGMMRQVRARLEGRAGAGVLQPWRDLRKLMRKQPITPDGTGWVFRMAPLVLAATALVAAAAVPLVSTDSMAGVSDLFAVVALLALGSVALALGGLDTGTAFGGMGASREVTVLALVEPTILVSVFALSVRAQSTDLGAIVGYTTEQPLAVVSPVSLLAAAALAIVTIAETGRIPVDNPATHLELTMIHEAMILEYAGPDLALIEWASAARMSVLLGLLASLFAPWGIATAGAGIVAVLVAVVALVVKVAVLGALLAAGEVFMAKLRLFRIPELLAGSFLMALLAVAASFFLA
ncbi:NADH-quinone oxidoreductase subunit H [Nonomuraea sp. NPDC005650]|uniref:respiratory chain complex I subunit 1 family protein n=1 Tax=Nonomuraea sp. NPDC005650 TaxID=3157045 RepID=UPI0033BF6541